MSKRKRRGVQCKKCGRRLTDELSTSRGYGPTCFGKTTKAVHAELEAAGQLTFPPGALEFRR